MKETKLLGALFPTHPDFLPIIQGIREKYNMPEISPDDPAYEQIYLGDELISRDDFRREIQILLENNLNFMPPETAIMYSQAKKSLGQPLNMQEFEGCPDAIKQVIPAFYATAQQQLEITVSGIDQFIADLTQMLYVYLLMGETEEVPIDWTGKVVTVTDGGEKIVLALASQMSNPDEIIQQFRQEINKTFGEHRPKVTHRMVSSAYYMRLKRAGKPWKFIVEEFIRREKISLPRDQNSKRYADIWRKSAQLLKKRIDRSEKVLDVILRDRKM